MFELITDYIKKPQAERQAHLKLDEECIKIGGYDSREFRGLLAHHLHTTIPTKVKVVLAHACHNGKCSNPRHLYWGTYKENSQDALNDTKPKNRKNGYTNGNVEAAKAGSSKGGKGQTGIPKSPEHRAKISESLRKRKFA